MTYQELSDYVKAEFTSFLGAYASVFTLTGVFTQDWKVFGLGTVTGVIAYAIREKKSGSSLNNEEFYTQQAGVLRFFDENFDGNQYVLVDDIATDFMSTTKSQYKDIITKSVARSHEFYLN